MDLAQIDSLMQDMAERLPVPEPPEDDEPGTAPHEMMPDVTIHDPRTFLNPKGLKDTRLQRSGQADPQIVAPPEKFMSPGYKGTTRTKDGYLVQPAGARRDDPRRQNQRNQRHADRYMGEVRTYLDKIRRGRSIRGVDPDQPAFSPQAETIRQGETVNRANLAETLTRRRPTR